MFIVSLIVALLAVAAFAFALWFSRLANSLRCLTSDTYAGVSAMFDTELSDDDKELIVRKAGFQLLGHAWAVVWRFALAFFVTVIPIYFAHWSGLVSKDVVFNTLLRVDFIVIVSLAAMFIVWILPKFRQNKNQDLDDVSGTHSESEIGNKIIHTIAFASSRTLRVAKGLDDRMFSRDIKRVHSGAPIFVTSLARGGTTALLNAMHGIPQVATHTYRDMPFITAPLLWSRLSGKHRNVSLRERAHSDGMYINLDSPEAFDEILWMLAWPEKYGEQGIELWNKTDFRTSSRDDFIRQFKKIALLRHPECGSRSDAGIRYLSKNNANISRLELLPIMFADCDIVVPIRHPCAHAASLLRQHTNFTHQHAEDSYVKRYMKDLGHFEFGELHRPILFGDNQLEQYAAEEPDYWMAYWIAAFTEVLKHSSNIHIVVQDELRENPDAVMSELLERLGLQSDGEFSTFFHNTPDARPKSLFSAELTGQAEELYAELLYKAKTEHSRR